MTALLAALLLEIVAERERLHMAPSKLAQGATPNDPGAFSYTPDDTSNGVLTVGVYHLQHPCAVPDCEREAKAADYCAAHLVRIARHGEPGPATFGAYIRGGLCSVPGCERRRYALALCSAHYMAARRKDAR